MNKGAVGLYLMSTRGLSVLTALLQEVGSGGVAYVVTASDPGVENDGCAEITAIAKRANVRVWDRREMPVAPPPVAARLAAGWRWMLPPSEREPLVVFHDSLLPRYRGFAPLVNALINAETTLGVTALVAAADYDSGPILAQEPVAIEYPLRIAEAIERVRPCYARLAVRVVRDLSENKWAPRPQDERQASYSLWRDEADYSIDWSMDAATIRRWVDATGSPFRGAATFAGERKLRVLAASERTDVNIENRTPGKIIFLEQGQPIVVCGRGLLRIEHLLDDQTRLAVLPWTKFRTRFTAFPAGQNG
jgi:methionyl-tRNA formyltransferase